MLPWQEPYFSDMVGSPRRIPRLLGAWSHRKVSCGVLCGVESERGIALRWGCEGCICFVRVGLVACLGNFRNSEVVSRDHGKLSIDDDAPKSHL